MKHINKATLILFLMSLSSCDYFQSTYYRGPTSDHYNGRKFHNTDPQAKPQFNIFGAVARGAKIILTNLILKKQPTFVPPVVPTPKAPPHKIQITFINHVTFLIQYEDKNILTDPFWSEYAGLNQVFSVPRIKSPGVKLSDLPKIDYILLSHNHYDHMDIATLRKINNQFHPHIFTGLGNCYYLNYIEKLNAKCTEMDWWQSVKPDSKTEITFTPAKHWSSRGIWDKNETLWGGFAININQKNKIFFAGDTGYDEHFEEIAKKLGAMKIALLPIGAYKPRKMLHHSHMSPTESVKVHKILKTEVAIAMHFGTFFGLSDEGPKEAIQELHGAMIQSKLSSDNFRVLEHGESIAIPMTPVRLPTQTNQRQVNQEQITHASQSLTE